MLIYIFILWKYILCLFYILFLYSLYFSKKCSKLKKRKKDVAWIWLPTESGLKGTRTLSQRQEWLLLTLSFIHLFVYLSADSFF